MGAAVAADREPIITDVIAPADTSNVNEGLADSAGAADAADGMGIEIVENSAELDIAAPVALGPTELSQAKDVVASAGTPVPYNASAATAAAQSASVMGQAVLLRTRLMYQLF